MHVLPSGSTKKAVAWFSLATITAAPFLAGFQAKSPTGEQWIFGSVASPFYTLGALVRWADWADLASLAVCLGVIALLAYERGDFDLS